MHNEDHAERPVVLYNPMSQAQRKKWTKTASEMVARIQREGNVLMDEAAMARDYAVQTVIIELTRPTYKNPQEFIDQLQLAKKYADDMTVGAFLDDVGAELETGLKKAEALLAKDKQLTPVARQHIEQYHKNRDIPGSMSVATKDQAFALREEALLNAKKGRVQR